MLPKLLPEASGQKDSTKICQKNTNNSQKVRNIVSRGGRERGEITHFFEILAPDGPQGVPGTSTGHPRDPFGTKNEAPGDKQCEDIYSHRCKITTNLDNHTVSKFSVDSARSPKRYGSKRGGGVRRSQLDIYIYIYIYILFGCPVCLHMVPVPAPSKNKNNDICLFLKYMN